MKRYALFTLVVLTMLTLTGCGDKELFTQEEVVEAYVNNIPNVEFIGVTHEEAADQWGENIYTFSNGDFTFEVENYMEVDSMFGISRNEIDCDYFYEMCKYLNDDLQKAAEDSGLTYELVSDSKYKDVEADTVRIDSYGSTYTYSNDLDIEYYIKDFSSIEKVEKHKDILYELIEKYMPTASTKRIHADNVEYAIKYVDNEAIKEMIEHPDRKSWTAYGWEHPAILDEMTAVRHIKYFENLYAYRVRLGEVIDEKLSVAQAKEYKANEINKLYIDGVEFNSEYFEENIKFRYDPHTDKYYTQVLFGKDDSSTGGSWDYIQREIIEKTYKDSTYITDNKKDETEYVINGNRYKADKQKKDDYVTYKISRNGFVLDTEYNNWLNRYKLSTAYISLDDFATILEMRVDKVDNEEMAVYLVTEAYDAKVDEKLRVNVIDWLEKLAEVMKDIRDELE